ncbi:Carbonic anhydrase [Hyella patelloides LEGE 07179]|uniref:Carbonic anhydrase n=1 Tax=Hyella patelloides LEGE 07179 TaxID=945734 RepID=A0A563VU77_9CYAN|nr:carbonic anhydrase [Hyella patelloides]VEP14955.1 Carbonic anhydrase [Hyella patelloides LEGE 07179]
MSKVISFNNNSGNSQNIHANVRASFNSQIKIPEIKSTAYVHSLAAVIGNVYLGDRVIVAPAASVRGDEGQPIWVGNDVKIQDCVVLHALETGHHDVLIEEAVVEVDGNYYGVYIDERVSLAHQCQVHGPASIGADTFVGMQSLVFRATVGKNCVIEPKALVMGVDIEDGRYVPAGALITTQTAADNLPLITPSYPLKDLNKAVAGVNTQLSAGYQRQARSSRSLAA